VTPRAIISIVLAVSAAACGGSTRPAAAPTPARPLTPTAGAAAAAPRAPGDSVDVSETEVERRAIEVFGDLPAATAAPDTAVPATAVEPAAPTWDIDVRSFETHERVEHYVNLFSGDGRDRIAQRLGVGTRYDPILRAKFRAAGLPEDLTYLALVESGYNPHAYSRAAAVGMWQFMASTARGMGLRVDWWVDERRDPMRSTDGAIRFISWLKDQLGSFYLAAAAYNGGPGRVARGLTRYAEDMEGATGDEMFFTLAEKNYLPAETRNYVPQLIAAALVAKEPAKYGLRIDSQPPFVYDSVQVPASTPLAAVATAAAVRGSEIADLNPHILRGMTPPGKPMYVRVPEGYTNGFDSAFAAIPKEQRTALQAVTSKKGQSLASIARGHGLSERQLAWYNPKVERSRTGRVYPGQRINVPSPAVVALALDVPDPAVERYSTSKAVRVHVVRRGESLGLIARKYGTTVERLKALNGLRKATIFPGQSLVVRGSLPKSSAKARVARGEKGASRSGRKASGGSASAGKGSGAATRDSAKGKSAGVTRSGRNGKAPRNSSSRGASTRDANND
jgi:membrane-bound lytic murein transglycosylase D